MTPEEIKEGNKLIAEFMGWYRDLEVNKGSDINWFHHEHSTKITSTLSLPVRPTYFKYHSSWDWLMPVVEKIETYRLVYPKHADFVCDCKIVVLKHVLYREVVEFIKWYNSQQQDNGTGN